MYPEALSTKSGLPYVSVILPVFNEERYLKKTLEYLRGNDYPEDRFEIVVVDNGSTDASFEIAQQYADRAVRLVDVNVGAVRNHGVEISRGDYIAFLDSDCLVPTDWIRKGVTRLNRQPSPILGGTLYLRDDPAWIEKYWLLDSQGCEVSQRDLLGSCIFIDRKSFLEVGGFNTHVTSGEDTMLSRALKAHGREVVIDRELGVIHLGNPRTVIEFVGRQAWHAENYVLKLSDSITDKVFLLVLLYLSGIVLGLAQMAGFLTTGIHSLLLVLIPPAILSVKRLFRARYSTLSPTALLSIYAVDHLYLAGRLIGLLKGLIRVAKDRKSS